MLSLTFAGTVGPHWCGFLGINGRLVTISVLSFERIKLNCAKGERFLVMATYGDGLIGRNQ
ncbi:MAG: hypothetical protein OSA51_02540 [Octadecabacter sp.]|nr:hypothetical protein [Octadecabacter sp.]